MKPSILLAIAICTAPSASRACPIGAQDCPPICGDDVAPLLWTLPSARGNAVVNIVNFEFAPSSIEVTVGDSVTWVNLDGAPHTTTSALPQWNSGTMNQNDTFTHTFTSVGSFDYFCDVHLSMQGVVNVAPVPEPGTVVSVMFLALGLAHWRRG